VILAGLILVITACSGTSPTPVPATAPPAASAATAAPATPAASVPVATTVPATPAPATEPPTGAPVSNLILRYCWGGEGEVSAMESIIKDFNASQSAIQVRGISGSIKTEEIAAAVAGGSPPDAVIMCNNEAIPGFAHDGVILPMDDLITQIGADTSNIIPASLAWVTYQGKLYGLPFLQDTWGFAWNTDEFTAAGLDPTKPPTTLQQLWDDAKKLTLYNNDGSIKQAGFIPDYPGKNLTEFSQLFGCNYYDEANKKITVDSPACVAWFDWYKKYYTEYDKKGALTNLIASKGSEDEDLFYTGKVAMGLFGEWLPGSAYAPNFAPNLKYETAPFPSDVAGEYGAGFVNGNAFFIPKGSKDPAAAATFGMYLMTDAPSRKMAIQNASVPQLKSLTTDPTLTAVPHFSTFLDIANFPKTWTNPMISQWSEFHDGMDTALDSVLTGGVASSDALSTVAKQIQGELDANGP
jgi:multiple sugar transport system substrate-binding protein